jgi:hypothetical protein
MLKRQRLPTGNGSAFPEEITNCHSKQTENYRPWRSSIAILNERVAEVERQAL